MQDLGCACTHLSRFILALMENRAPHCWDHHPATFQGHCCDRQGLMCILPELDLILGTLPRGPPMLDLLPTLTPNTLLSPPSLFPCQTNRSRIASSGAPACSIAALWQDHVRICVAECFVCFSQQWRRRGGFVCGNRQARKQRAGVTLWACFDACVYILCTGVCCRICASLYSFACLFTLGDKSGGNRRCTCCHKAVISLAEFSRIIVLSLLAHRASKHRWNGKKRRFGAWLSETPHLPTLSRVSWHGNWLHNQPKTFTYSLYLKA